MPTELAAGRFGYASAGWSAEPQQEAGMAPKKQRRLPTTHCVVFQPIRTAYPSLKSALTTSYQCPFHCNGNMLSRMNYTSTARSFNCARPSKSFIYRLHGTTWFWSLIGLGTLHTHSVQAQNDVRSNMVLLISPSNPSKYNQLQALNKLRHLLFVALEA